MKGVWGGWVGDIRVTDILVRFRNDCSLSSVRGKSDVNFYDPMIHGFQIHNFNDIMEIIRKSQGIMGIFNIPSYEGKLRFIKN